MNEQLPHTDMVNDWIVGYLTNSLTPEEMQSLQNWLNVSEENREYFSDMQEVWIAASDEADEQHFDKERAYQLFLEHTESLVRPSLKRKAFTISPWIYVAAMVVIVFFCGTIAFQSGKRVLQNQLTQITVEAPYGSKTKLYLPDGTLVWLNAGSKMSYAQDFGINERSLNLSGEAYFEVSKNEKIPFFVNTETNKVRVVGTSFNVCAYNGSNEFETTLVTGIVDIYTLKGEKPITRLEKGEFFGLYNGKAQKKILPSYDYLKWKEGLYCFDDSPLSCMFSKLEKYYNVKITVNNPKLLDYHCTGKFKEQDGIEHILRVIQKDHKFTYHINEERDSIAIE